MIVVRLSQFTGRLLVDTTPWRERLMVVVETTRGFFRLVESITRNRTKSEDWSAP